MSSSVTMQFRVTARSYSKRAGKDPKFKVVLETGQGDRLQIVSDSRDIYEGYPETEVFDVTVKKAQRTMDEFSSNEEEDDTE